MPANFIVRSIRPNNGIIQLHLSLDLGQPNEIWLNVTPQVLAMIFGDDVREGDVRAMQAPLINRAGSNGKKR